MSLYTIRYCFLNSCRLLLQHIWVGFFAQKNTLWRSKIENDFLCEENENFLWQHYSSFQDARLCTLWKYLNKLRHCRNYWCISDGNIWTNYVTAEIWPVSSRINRNLSFWWEVYRDLLKHKNLVICALNMVQYFYKFLWFKFVTYFL